MSNNLQSKRLIHHIRPPMQSVTREEWGDYLSCFPNVIQTESIFGDHSVMYSRTPDFHGHGDLLAEVHYCADGNHLYFIKGEAK